MQDILNNGIPDQVKKLFIVQSHKVILVTIISTIVTMLERIEIKEWYCESKETKRTAAEPVRA